jgi:hypothetical protein
MYCGQCGNQIDDDSRFCRHCGAAQALKTNPVAPSARPLFEGGSKEPTPKSPNRLGWIIGAAVSAVLLLSILSSHGGTSNPAPSGAQSNADTVADNMDAAADALDAVADNISTAAPIASTPWTYTSDDDKVRSGVSYYAATTSTNAVRQEAPYDSETTMRMTVRKTPAFGTDVVLTISSGQLMCPSYEGCSGTVRFDDGPARRVRFNGPADDSSDTIFVVGASSFIADLKKAKKVIIEKTLYEAGNPQFEFDVHGLKWEH